MLREINEKVQWTGWTFMCGDPRHDSEQVLRFKPYREFEKARIVRYHTYNPFLYQI